MGPGYFIFPGNISQGLSLLNMFPLNLATIPSALPGFRAPVHASRKKCGFEGGVLVHSTPVTEPASRRRKSGSAATPRSPFAGGGEMGELVRAYPWQDSALGPVSGWPQSLRAAVQILLNSRYAMFVWWGPDLINLYNDPYRAFLGVKHPAALGKSAREVWSEIWEQIGPRTEAVLQRGESTFDEALLLLMARHGYVEETYFTFSYSPMPDDNGAIGGIFCAVAEETMRVIGERRLRLLGEITGAMVEARTPTDVCETAARCLEGARRDLPFSLLYLLEPDGRTLTLCAAAGIEAGHAAAPPALSLDNGGTAWPLDRVIESGETVVVEDLARRFSGLPKGEWQQPPEQAVLLPIAQQGQPRPAGVFIAGLNPHRKFADQFHGFVSVLANQIAGAVANANAYEAERKRAEELAELDLRRHASSAT